MKITAVAPSMLVSHSKKSLMWPVWFKPNIPDSKITGRFNEVNSQPGSFQEPSMTQLLLRFPEKTSQSCNCAFIK